MFTVIPSTYSSPGDPCLRLNEINNSAARDFVRCFPSISTDKWLKLDNGYMAKFTSKGIKTQVFYSNDGGFVLCTKYYTEENMPSAIKKNLRQRFVGYSVIAVTAVIYQQQSFFRINIKNNNWMKTVMITGSTLEVLENMVNCEPR